MSKHTPGPWTLGHNWRGKMAICGPKFNHDPDGESIASLSVDRICNVPYRADQQGPANAHLIAAAPEMYVALRAMLSGNEGSRDLAIAAIAKAEGK
jgi:hypothetical protein